MTTREHFYDFIKEKKTNQTTPDIVRESLSVTESLRAIIKRSPLTSPEMTLYSYLKIHNGQQAIR